MRAADREPNQPVPRRNENGSAVLKGLVWMTIQCNCLTKISSPASFRLPRQTHKLPPRQNAAVLHFGTGTERLCCPSFPCHGFSSPMERTLSLTKLQFASAPGKQKRRCRMSVKSGLCSSGDGDPRMPPKPFGTPRRARDAAAPSPGRRREQPAPLPSTAPASHAISF